jgi:hypothetical protein
MPPKKDAKKGGEAEPELGPEELLVRSKLRIESLERELVARSEVMNKAVAEQMKMRQKVSEFHQDIVKEKQDTFAITSDMTRQYKQMQEDLLRRNNEQQLQIEDLKDQVYRVSLLPIFPPPALCTQFMPHILCSQFFLPQEKIY